MYSLFCALQQQRFPWMIFAVFLLLCPYPLYCENDDETTNFMSSTDHWITKSQVRSVLLSPSSVCYQPILFIPCPPRPRQLMDKALILMGGFRLGSTEDCGSRRPRCCLCPNRLLPSAATHALLTTALLGLSTT